MLVSLQTTNCSLSPAGAEVVFPWEQLLCIRECKAFFFPSGWWCCLNEIQILASAFMPYMLTPLYDGSSDGCIATNIRVPLFLESSLGFLSISRKAKKLGKANKKKVENGVVCSRTVLVLSSSPDSYCSQTWYEIALHIGKTAFTPKSLSSESSEDDDILVVELEKNNNHFTVFKNRSKSLTTYLRTKRVSFQALGFSPSFSIFDNLFRPLKLFLDNEMKQKD